MKNTSRTEISEDLISEQEAVLETKTLFQETELPKYNNHGKKEGSFSSILFGSRAFYQPSTEIYLSGKERSFTLWVYRLLSYLQKKEQEMLGILETGR